MSSKCICDGSVNGASRNFGGRGITGFQQNNGIRRGRREGGEEGEESRGRGGRERKAGRREGMGREMEKEEGGRDRLEDKIHVSTSSAQ